MEISIFQDKLVFFTILFPKCFKCHHH